MALQVDQYESTLLQSSKAYKRRTICSAINQNCSHLTISYCLHIAAGASYCGGLTRTCIERRSSLRLTQSTTDKLPEGFHRDLLRAGDAQSISASKEKRRAVEHPLVDCV